jgi:hypothetical protein
MRSAPPSAFVGRTDRHGRINTTLARRRFNVKIRRALRLAHQDEETAKAGQLPAEGGTDELHAQ